MSEPHTLQERLRAALLLFPPVKRYLVAFSGGLDSTVLLHLLAQLREELSAPIEAIHIHHGLQTHADSWLEQCGGFAAELQIPFTGVRVEVARNGGEGLEAAARHARYHAIAARMGEGTLLLTAHHRDDQAETLLLQLLRGAGVAGAAAMAPLKPFSGGWHGRPLLDTSRGELLAYGEAHGLRWSDDPSNFDVKLERNFLRQQVVPLLEERYPALSANLSRSARHFAAAQGLLGELAEIDLTLCGTEDGLSVSLLRELNEARQRNLLRHWIATSGFRLPDSRRLQQICDEVLTANADAMPLVAWQGAELRRYRDTLFLMAPLGEEPDGPISWSFDRPLRLPAGLGILSAREATGEGLTHSQLAGRSIEVRFRQGGERCRPAGRQERHELKKLWQEAEVPPWQRGRMPLLYVEGELAQVGNLWHCEPFAAKPDEAGIVVEWLPLAIENGNENNDN